MQALILGAGDEAYRIVFSKFSMHQNNWEGLLKYRLL